MELRRFYTSPVNHHNLTDWPALAGRLERAVREAAPEVSVEHGGKPVFGYGGDARAALEAERQLAVSPRHVRIDLWSSIVSYETICVTFGAFVTEREARAVAEGLETEELAALTFLREVEDEYDIEAARVYGYAFDGSDEDLQDIESQLLPFDPPIYIGPRSCVLDANGSIGGAFEVFREAGDVVVFLVEGEDETVSRRLWSSRFASGGEGLVVMYAGDEAEDAIVERFAERDDLRILIADAPSAGMRVTMGRCHADDSLVVFYTPPYEPEIDQRLVFVI